MVEKLFVIILRHLGLEASFWHASFVKKIGGYVLTTKIDTDVQTSMTGMHKPTRPI